LVYGEAQPQNSEPKLGVNNKSKNSPKTAL